MHLPAPSYIYTAIVVPVVNLAPLAAMQRHRPVPPGFMLLSVYLVLSFVTNIAASICAALSMNNLPLLHIYTLLEFIVLSYYYSCIMERPSFGRWAAALGALFVIFCAVDALVLQSIYKYNTYPRSVGAIIVVVYAVCYFKKILDSGSITALQRAYLLINCGILLYFGSSFFLFTTANMLRPHYFMNRILWNIHAGMVLAMYLFFTAGALYAKQRR